MAAQDVISSVWESLQSKLSAKSSSSQSSIFRVPPQLRQVKERAYEPQIISIGPYHHAKDPLKEMETHKVCYLSDLLKRQNGLGSYITESISMEKRARDCYAETVEMSSADFVEMMVLDGLFVVELIRKFKDAKLRKEHDALFKQHLNLTIISQDLLLLENQLPFFVLERFAVMTDPNEESFVNKALHFFSGMVPGPGMQREEADPTARNFKHLLGLVHENWFPSHELDRTDQCNSRPLTFPEMMESIGLQMLFQSGEPQRNDLRIEAEKGDFIRSATELLHVGIRFKKGSGNSLFDVKFAKGQMHIPTLIVNHDTERIFRNLIAYEQFNQGRSIVMDYARLMDCLINYTNDVDLLCDCGIIDNCLGSNEEVAKMFNKLNDYVYLSKAKFYYSEIFQKVNKYRRRRCNILKVKLRQTYFLSPWDWILIPIIAATMLLLLSLLQTIFSVLAYFK